MSPRRAYGKERICADANRRFSTLLRGVRKGRSYIVTLHGRPVAKLIPAETDETQCGGSKGRTVGAAEIAACSKGREGTRRWTRGELYRGPMRISFDTNVVAYAEGANARVEERIRLRLCQILVA